jgi:Zn-dependent peptidase ImmA (M78 family)/transcriptional regulator with XRE-family HTH domain
MKEKLPVNAEVLKWARTSLSLSREDVAQRLGAHFKVETLLAWENGEASPTYPQLEKLAHDIYKRPVAVFFFPDVPPEETPKTEFRTLPDTIIDKLPPEIIKLYRKAKLFQLNLEELFEGERPVEASLLDTFSLNGNSRLESTTVAIRSALGISVDEQSKWRSVETAFKSWREALDAHGIFVFKDGFRNDDYSGFSLYDQKYPLIFVNNSMPDSRQVFTLFHELGHLLYHNGGIDFRRREVLRSFHGHLRSVEVSCNKFASEFLVPPTELAKFKPEISEEHFQKLAEHFSVSREVILRNYLDRGLVTATYYEKMAAKWAQQAKARREEASGGGNYYDNHKAYLGERYINLAYRKYYQSKITADTLADYLNLKVKHLPTFEHLVLEGGKV